VRIEPGQKFDIESTARCLVGAFEADPLMNFLFPKDLGPDRPSKVERFFSILLDVRIARDMPVLVAILGTEVVGAAMGYDSTRPPWPEPNLREWERLLLETPNLPERLGTYERITSGFEPSLPHYYLGVIGVAQNRQGTGVGKALLEAFCDCSENDPTSSGVYLETANLRSLEFYKRNRFALRGQGDLNGSPLWCVFRSTGKSGVPSTDTLT
jgi:GNAT superfamily N-acetyltransferase